MSPAKKRDLGLILAIVFAALMVSGSLIFFALQLGGGRQMNDDAFAAQFEKYIEDRQEKEAVTQEEAFMAEIRKTSDVAKNVTAVAESDHVFGEKGARISLIEYSDFQCPYCQRFHGTAKQIVDKYAGSVNWVYRHYPLSFHEPAASRQAIASECVAELGGNGSFWSFVDLIFENPYENDEQMAKLALEVGVDENAMNDCLNSGKYDSLVAAQMADATDVGVTGTPGNIILNNETGEAIRIDGAQKQELFEKFIDEMLAE